MSILSHAMWRRLEGYLQIEIYDRDGGHADPRIRIEFRDVPPALMHEAMFVQVECVACARPINPFRRREGDSDRLYYACACPVTVRAACSRGTAAADAYEAIKERGKLLAATPNQLALF